MDDKSINLWRQIERCRRIAGMMTDDEIRDSLEKLALEYESRILERRGAGFMLQPRDPESELPTPHSNG